MDNEEINGLLKKLLLELKKQYNVKKLVLFGSYSNGTNRIDSDIDVAVLIDKIQGDFFSTIPQLWKISGDIDPRIEPILFDDDYVDNSGFLKTILEDGIVIT